MFIELIQAEPSSLKEWALVMWSTATWLFCIWRLTKKSWPHRKRFLAVMGYTLLYACYFFPSAAGYSTIGLIFLLLFAAMSFVIIGPPKKH